MRYFLLLFFALCTYNVVAQDVIVLKDGSTIISKVLEINQHDIKYKKYSNQNGPTYTINISDIESITYSNGEKEAFENSNNHHLSLNNKVLSLENDMLLCNYNDRIVKNTTKKSNKRAKWIYRCLKVHSQSLIIQGEVNISIDIKQEKNGIGDKAYFNLFLENNSNQMVYLDLENSTFRINDIASKYYVNSSTTKTDGSERGVSINMGAITNVLGIDGVANIIASGTNLGGGKNSSSSTTVYADRIITIAPHSKYMLPIKSFYDSDYDKAYSKDFKCGEQFIYEQPKLIKDAPWEFIVSYVEENNANQLKRLNLGLYISEELAIGSSWEKDVVVETQEAPLHYCFKVNGGWLRKDK